jgi:hypothetical protein
MAGEGKSLRWDGMDGGYSRCMESLKRGTSTRFIGSREMLPRKHERACRTTRKSVVTLAERMEIGKESREHATDQYDA